MSAFVNAKGRGTTDNPGNRFERLHVEIDDGSLEEIARVDEDFEEEVPKTEFFRDDAQSIITTNKSPDLGFDASLNPYRGCEHGCAYCYARPYHEYLGFRAGLDFETKIMVKENAPELLERELAARRWTPQNLACSGVTDPYQPVERRLRITRGCLEVLAKFRNPVGIVTKSGLVERDVDFLQQLAAYDAAGVMLSVTTLNTELAMKMEPRASTPAARLRALKTLSSAGIPCGVSVAPIIPGLNDHEIPAILEAAADHGAQFAVYTMLRLPYAVKDVFTGWLDRHYAGHRGKVLGRVGKARGGKLNESGFGSRMKGEGPVAEEIERLFDVSVRKHRLNRSRMVFSTAAFRRSQPGQLELF